MKLPGLDVKALLADIDPQHFNPVRCCVCVAVGHRDVPAATVVRGYAVCLDHIAIDEHLSLRAYADAIIEAFGGPR